MKLAACFHSIIEVIDQVLTHQNIPADRLLHEYLRKRRFIGSHDRKFITEHLYSLLRHWPLLTYYHQPSSVTSRLAVMWYLIKHLSYTAKDVKDIFKNENYCPPPLTCSEIQALEFGVQKNEIPEWAKASVPEWLWERIQKTFGDLAFSQMKAFNQPASFDIRTNILKTKRENILNVLADLKIKALETPYSPWGIRIHQKYNLQNHNLWLKGLIETQDESSQLASLLVEALPGMRILDFCAGAGGKSLAIAAMMQNKGVLVATDIHEWRLKRARERLKRADVTNTECRLINEKWLKRQEQSFDRVLVDAPCSGTGTWRRNPDLKIRFNPENLKELLLKQRSILDQASKLIKTGGRLIYATCSILKEENNDQIENFLKNHPHFSLISIKKVWENFIDSPYPGSEPFTLQLTPYQHQTDGFFIGILERKF